MFSCIVVYGSFSRARQLCTSLAPLMCITEAMKDFHPEDCKRLRCSCDEPRLPPLQAELPQENARRWGPPGGITAAAHNLGALEEGLKLRVPILASVSLVHHTLA